MAVSRLNLNHPALATAGGSALWTLINNIYQQIGDAVPGRYLTATSVANAATVTLTHNYGAAFSEYRYALYSASSGVLGSRLFSGWTVAANATNPLTQVDVTNNSGSTSDIILVLLHNGGNVNYTYMDFQQLAATPAVPASGFNRIYPKSDGNLYSLSSGGLEQAIGASGTGSKNYVPTASQSGVGQWVTAGMTATTSTLASELPRANTTKQALKLVPTPASFTFTSTGSGQTLTSTAAHGMQTGYVVNVATTGTLPAPLAVTTPYYVNVLSTTTFQLAASMANLVTGSYLTYTSAGSGTQSATYAVAYLRFTLDATDYGLPQQLAWAQNILSGITNDYEVDVWANTASAYTGTTTRLALKSDASGVSYLPNALGTYTNRFDGTSTSNPYLELRVVKVAQNTHGIVLSDISVGPGIIIAGPPVGSTTSNVYPLTFSSGFGTVTNSNSTMTRIADRAIFKGAFTTGTVAAAPAYFIMPSGMTINGSVLSPLNTTTSVGLTRRLSNNSNPLTAADINSAIFYDGSINNQLFVSNVMGTNSYQKDNGNVHYGSNQVVEFEFTVPINEWAFSALNLGSNSPEYAYNSDTTVSNNTTAFAYGPSGIAISSAFNGTAKRVRFLSPIQATDQIVLEVQRSGGTPWFQLVGNDNQTGIQALVYQNGTPYGIGLSFTNVANNTDVDVVFGSYGYSNSTYGSAGVTWASFTGFNWRVKKFSSNAVVPFGPYLPPSPANPSGFSGLIPSSGVPGRTDGNAATTGNIGERITASLATISQASPVNNTYYDDTGTLTLSAGSWTIYCVGSVYGDNPGSISGLQVPIVSVGLRTSANVVVQEIFACSGQVNGVSFFGVGTVVSTVDISATTVYKMSIKWQPNTGSPTLGTVSSTAKSYLYAIRK